MKLGFEFIPIDSYAYSGESSAKTLNREDEFLSKSDSYYSRRYSFYVSTDKEPPLTTVMGAIRFMLLKMTGTTVNNYDNSWQKLIGGESFSVDNPPVDMGIIRSISSVMIRGKIAGREVYCVKAPRDQSQAGNDTVYQPMNFKDFNAKNPIKTGYLVSDENSLKWISDNALFTTFDQPSVYATANDNLDGRYHIQQRCRLRDANLETKNDDSPALSSPSFYVEVDLVEDSKLCEVKFPFEQVISLGGRSSSFLCRVNNINGSGVNVPKIDIQTEDYRLALISPAFITKESMSDCKFAITQYKAYRSATTSYDGGSVQMKLQSNRRFLAEAGCVFTFDDSDTRNKFMECLEMANKSIRICGFGQYITYGGKTE